MKQVILFIFLLALLSSCGGKSKSSSVIEAEKAIPLRYAENLSLSATEDYTIARLRNPWDTTSSYFLHLKFGRWKIIGEKFME